MKMKFNYLLFVSTIFFAAFIPATQSQASVHFERSQKLKCYPKYRHDLRGKIQCYMKRSFNDEDPSVYVFGERVRSLESKKTRKPITCWGCGNSDSLLLNVEQLERHIFYLQELADESRGYGKPSWSSRTFKLTNKSKW